jgi:ABC-type transport system substrate-binding protein
VTGLAVFVVSGTEQVVALDTPSDLNTGPYVNDVIYEVISSQDQRILALQAGTVEMDASFFDPVHLPVIDADPDISVYSALRNGYGHLTINCRDYPLNISGLRRAFAFAYDKTRVTSEIMDGFSREHDSIVPYANGWCVEDQFTYHYYTAQVATANQLLDDLGFVIDGVTGYRLAPNGDPFEIVIEYASTSVQIGGGVAQIGVDALTALDIDARTQASDFNDYISRLDSHGDYDMVFYAASFYTNDVDWLAYSYWGDYADTPFQNPTNFDNATYDSWRDQLLYSTTYQDVYEAAQEMQNILQYNVPRLIVYENTYMQAYRNDQFTGHVEDFSQYISGPWTMRKIKLLDGSPGGQVPVAIGQEPDSFNIFVTNSGYSATILSNLYSSLYKHGPDLTPWPDLAESMLVETHADNIAVPSGHTRYTIDIVQNATWSDTTPLTADDVTFTFTYAYESGAYGNPAAADLGDLVAAYSPTPYRAVLEFSAESYWQFSSFAYDYIIPKHIFNDVDGIGYSGWNTWNPVFSSDPQVTSGPYLFDDYDAGDWYRITKNPLYYYLPQNPSPTVSSVASIEYMEGTTGNEIVWTASDDNPLLYSIIVDSNPTPVATGIWDGSDIIHNIDGLSIGTYNYTLLLFDYSANFVFSSVMVSVIPYTNTTTVTTPTTTTTTTTSTTGGPGLLNIDTLTMLISLGSMGVILIVVVLIYKTKQS